MGKWKKRYKETSQIHVNLISKNKQQYRTIEQQFSELESQKQFGAKLLAKNVELFKNFDLKNQQIVTLTKSQKQCYEDYQLLQNEFLNKVKIISLQSSDITALTNKIKRLEQANYSRNFQISNAAQAVSNLLKLEGQTLPPYTLSLAERAKLSQVELICSDLLFTLRKDVF